MTRAIDIQLVAEVMEAEGIPFHVAVRRVRDIEESGELLEYAAQYETERAAQLAEHAASSDTQIALLRYMTFVAFLMVLGSLSALGALLYTLMEAI